LWVVKQELVWYNGTPNFDKIRFYPATERIYWLAKSPKTKLYNTISHNDVFGQGEWKPEGTSKQHTRAFPEKMVSDLIKCFPNAKTVYDPFLGSGTVGKVCQDLGIDWVGSEINPEYCRLAEERIFGTL
jgi:DNA modification methylase